MERDDSIRNVLVGIADPVPVFRRGLAAALQNAGFAVEAVDDPAAWACRAGADVLVLTARMPDDRATLAQLQASNERLFLVVLLRDAEPPAYADAIAAGATAAVAWDAAPEDVVAVVEAARRDQCLLPVRVVRVLAHRTSVAPALPEISAAERKWLQTLCDGGTVADIAREASYSPREMFRLLDRLYRRLGARNRVEAIVMAARAGLLDTGPASDE